MHGRQSAKIGEITAMFYDFKELMMPVTNKPRCSLIMNMLAMLKKIGIDAGTTFGRRL